MRTLSISLLVVLVALPAAAKAQTYDGDQLPYGAYAYAPHHSSTVAEGLFRGLGDAWRSTGLFNLRTTQAAVYAAQARRYEMENNTQALAGYFEARQSNRAYRAAQRGPRPSQEDLIRYGRAAGPKRLTPSEFSPITGKVSWPVLLRSEAFAEHRIGLERLLAVRAAAGKIPAEGYLKVLESTGAMKERLKDRVRELPPADYLAAKKFLESLAYEARLSSGFQPLVAKLR